MVDDAKPAPPKKGASTRRRPEAGRRPGPSLADEQGEGAAAGAKSRSTAATPKSEAPSEGRTERLHPAAGLGRKELAEKYTPYVRSIAGKVKKTLSKDIEFDDLVSYGMLGLFEAADRFDAKYGANFMTFAYYRIRGAIYDGLRGMGWVSRTEYQRYRFEQHANAYLTNVHEQNLSVPSGIKRSDDDEVGELANVVEGLVTIYVTALDAMEGFQIADDRSPSIDESIEIQQARELVSQALEKLGGQERQLLELYYYRELSLEEVGKHLGLSKSWTSRLHTRAIQKMGRLLKDLVEEYNEDRRAPAEKRKGGPRPTQPSGPATR